MEDIFYPADETVDNLATASDLAVKIRDLAKDEDVATPEQARDLADWTEKLGEAISAAQASYESLRMAV